MFCKKCNGRVFIDRMFEGKKKNAEDEINHLELFCVMCGKRWMLSRDNTFAKALLKQEKARNQALAIKG